MRFFENVAKKVFNSEGIRILEGHVAYSPEEAVAVCSEMGVPVVVKAQVLTGGRGKAGGVKFADNPGEALKVADEILGIAVNTETGFVDDLATSCTMHPGNFQYVVADAIKNASVTGASAEDKLGLAISGTLNSSKNAEAEKDGVAEVGATIVATTVNAEGKVIYDNNAPIGSMNNHSDREEIKEALEKGAGTAVRSHVDGGIGAVAYGIVLDGGAVGLGEHDGAAFSAKPCRPVDGVVVH